MGDTMTFDLTQWLRNQANENQNSSVLPIEASNLNNLGKDDSKEWLITNGLGTYAGAALSGANTRRYHGLLVALPGSSSEAHYAVLSPGRNNHRRRPRKPL
jgi:hypothetical protein